MTGRLGAAIAAMALTAALTAALPVWAGPLVADIWRQQITIDSGFTGADELLYGAIDGKGDLVIVVRGPDERVVVRRKDRVAGVWVNRDKIEFENVPAYYAVGSIRSLEELTKIVPQSLLARHQIGLDALRLTPLTSRPAEEIAPFRAALIRNRVRDELYRDQTGEVEFLGERLFRMPLHFPANVPEGTYKAQFVLFRGGEVVGEETIELPIRKTGFQAKLDSLAHKRPAYYGFSAIVLALFAGWVAAVVFRKP